MQCETAHQMLELKRPGSGDLVAPEFAELVVHLRQCPSCQDRASRLERIDQKVRRAMTQVPVPAGLQQRLLAELQKNGDMSQTRKRCGLLTARVRWHRAAMVAAALAAACLALMIWHTNRPIRTNIDEMQQIAGSLYDAQSKTWHVIEGRFEHQFEIRQREEQWVKSRSRPPERLRQQYQVGIIPQNVLGNLVGMYCYYYDFAGTPVKAHVYAISDRQVRLEVPLRMGPPYQAEVGSENELVTVIWGEEGFVYVMVYRGDPTVLDRVFSVSDPLTLAAASFSF